MTCRKRQKHPACIELSPDRLERVALSGERHRGRTVDRTERDAVLVWVDLLLRVVRIELRREHPAGARRQPHRSAALENDPRRFAQVQRPRNVRRRDLTYAVADDCRGPDSPRLPERRQRHLHGEDRGLRDRRLGEPRVALIAQKLLEKVSSPSARRASDRTRRSCREIPAHRAATVYPSPTTVVPDRRTRRRHRSELHLAAERQQSRGRPRSRSLRRCARSSRHASRRRARGAARGGSVTSRRSSKCPREGLCAPRPIRGSSRTSPPASVAPRPREPRSSAVRARAASGAGRARRGDGFGSAWRTACALLPPKPKELMPATTSRPLSSTGRSSSARIGTRSLSCFEIDARIRRAKVQVGRDLAAVEHAARA